MSWPPAIKTFTVTFGPGTSLALGTDLGMKVDFTPSASAVWAATGTPLIALVESATAVEGMEGTATLPNPDQDGFIDGNGNAVKNWTYRAAVSYTQAGRVVATASKVFTVTAADTTVDLDTLIPVTSSAGVVISIPDTWSTSVAAAEQAATDAVAAAAGKYAKPSGGIPKTDLAAAVGTSLGKADTVSDLVTSGRLSETALSDTIVAGVGSYGRWPVMSVTTVDPQAVIGDDYVDATFTVTEPGMGVTYRGAAGIQLHGNSTASYPKKPYKIKLDSKANLLGMTHKAKKWVLLANWLDPAGLNNSFALDFAAQMSDWFVPEVKPLELILNGKFNGFYLMVDDKNDIGSGRVPGDDPTDSPDDDSITGTFLLEADNKEGTDGTPGFMTTRGQFFAYDDDIENTAQIAYITGWMQALEDKLFGADFLDPESGWAPYVDMQSIVDEYLINELTYNQDSASTSALFSSYFFYKTADAPESDGKLYGGPLWDFDRSLGVVGSTTYNPPTGWKTRNAGWITQMFRDPAFWGLVAERWAVLKSILAGWEEWVDSTLNPREDALRRNYSVWSADLGEPFVPQLSDTRKRWLATRIAWLDPLLSAPANPVPSTVTAAV